MPVKKKTIDTIDKFIFGLIILFIISLTNSIFANQIENKFEKNGLEISFALFLTAEFISALFSINHTQAFQNFFKRLVLIPIVYTVAASVNDSERAKLYFKIYLGAALITMVVYIIIAYEHFVAQLYSIEAKGPSPFQYVMTAGGLMSITTIFLFALMLNERAKLKIRVFYIAAFVVSATGLFSSYTRAAWLGAAAGIIVIILLKRKWILLVPIFALAVLALFYFKNESKIYRYDYEDDKLVENNSYATGGRASRVMADGISILVADHQNGIAVYQNDRLVQTIETPSPAIIVNKWRDDLLYSYLIDSRIILLKKGADGQYQKEKSFYTTGITYDIKTRSNNLYVADLDSGLTIFKHPDKIAVKAHYSSMKGITNFDCDSSWFVSFTPEKNILRLYKVRDGFPVEAVDSVVNKSPNGYLYLSNKMVYFQSDDEFLQYKIAEGKLRKVASQKLKGIFRMEIYREQIFACTMNGIIYSADNNAKQPLHFREIAQLNYSPTDFKIAGEQFYFSYYKRNRLTSIFDPYHDTNIERFDQWRTGLKIFASHPIFGVGDIDLNKVYSEYKDPYLKQNFGHLHNNYMHFLVILGLFGFSAVIFMFVKIHLLNIKIFRAVKNIPFVSSYSLGTAGVFIGFLFSGLGEWNFGDQEIITMIWFTLGLNIAFYKSHLKSQDSGSRTGE